MQQELIQKARHCKSIQKLLALAQENGVEITEEQAKDIFAKLNPANGEIADEELDNVSGGCGYEPEQPDESQVISYIPCPSCGHNRWFVIWAENPCLLKCTNCGCPLEKKTITEGN